MRISFVQTQIIWQQPAANLAQFEEKMAPLADKTDLILLPEMCTTGFTWENLNLAETDFGITLKWLKAQSAKLNAAIIAGQLYKSHNRYFNRLIFVTPDGGFSSYHKRHLFSAAGEHNAFTPGRKRLIVEWRGWRICPMICYDLRFPVYARNKIGPKGYDLLLYIANWPNTRINHWKTLLEARAIENQTFVAGLNIVGTDGNKLQYSGDSLLFDAKGAVIADLGNAENIQTIELDLAAQREWQRVFPALSDADKFRLL